MFDELLVMLRLLITKRDIKYRKALEPGLNVAMTMRHLIIRDRYMYASMRFDIGVLHNTMSVCVREVYHANINAYRDECIKCPTTSGMAYDFCRMFS